MNVDGDSSNAVERIRTFLTNRDYRQAVELVVKFDAVNREMRIEMQFDQQCLYFLVLLKSYLFNNYDDDYDAQERVVQFLFDSMEFSEIITQAVPKIEELLLSKVNSDVFEAIDFFTTGYLFNIKGTECGMRRMLCLVWTGDKEKRAAVTKAYNRVLFQTDSEGR